MPIEFDIVQDLPQDLMTFALIPGQTGNRSSCPCGTGLDTDDKLRYLCCVDYLLILRPLGSGCEKTMG